MAFQKGDAKLSNPSLGIDILEDDDKSCCSNLSANTRPGSCVESISVLGELPTNRLPATSSPRLDSLACDFEKLHLDPADVKHSTTVASRQSETGRQTPEPISNLEASPRDLSAIAGSRQSDNESQLFNHLAVTEIEGDEELGISAATIQKAGEVTHRNTTASQQMSSEKGIVASLQETETSESALNRKDNGILEQPISLPPTQLASRIEDSVEALDELEYQLEAINAATQLRRAPTPDTRNAKVRNVRPRAAACSSTNDGGSRWSHRTVTTKAQAADADNPMRSSTEEQSDTNLTRSSAAQMPSTRAPISRPASLLPPKAPVRWRKPPTIPTFELPGEAVARRLKEKRESRLSMQLAQEQKTPKLSVLPARSRSTRAPIQPNFELPGEAISRRKREEWEKQQREQEMIARSKTQFKAAPIRYSMTPKIQPRDTASSRARQSKVSSGGSNTETAQSSAKRTSTTVAQTSRDSLAASASPHLGPERPSRGRQSMVSSQLTVRTSRATSSSTVSVGGSVSKRSAVSAEDVQQQRSRGREIYNRDNSYVANRERERREREEMAKQARRDAAERSRQLSREWAERQKMKKLASRTSITPVAVRP
ncbi:hypothetical protein VTK73DRAFT_10025 [Phialemonium thermophilum]|uniref:TPX2 C-terminal domain-containing protein n=1 Tax=Phialemonium thermophilum TaxID=223376 RepID=A0ABR3Y5U4_9PEZI